MKIQSRAPFFHQRSHCLRKASSFFTLSSHLCFTPPSPSPLWNQPLSVTVGLFDYQVQSLPRMSLIAEDATMWRSPSPSPHTPPLPLSALLRLHVHPLLSETELRLHICRCAHSCALALSSVCVRRCSSSMLKVGSRRKLVWHEAWHRPPVAWTTGM